MKSKGNIVFLGMMGAGKSSIGKLVSKKLKLDFFDVDKLIENEIGMSIAKIFDNKGEKKFRELEEKITLNALNKNNIVIALGGGAFLNKNIRQEILANHMSFWLNWDADILIKRIRNSSKRPIAFRSTKEELINLIKKRSSIYSKALYKIDCKNLTKDEVVGLVLKFYESTKIKNKN